MEKNEVMGLLIFVAVAVVGAALLMTGGLNISQENTGLATGKQYISQKTLASVQASQHANCISFCEKDKNSCDATAYNKYLSCSGNYKATQCASNWDKAKLACANVYYGCVDRCSRYL